MGERQTCYDEATQNKMDSIHIMYMIELLHFCQIPEGM